MKTVFNNSDLPHIWAHQSQEYGRASNMHFEAYPLRLSSSEPERLANWSASRIFSYRTIMGAIITRPDGEQLAIINNHSYSNSTAKQQGRIAYAVNHLPNVYYPVYLQRGSSSFDIESQALFNGLVRETHERAAEYVASSKKRRKESTRGADLIKAHSLLGALQRLAEFFGYEYARPSTLDGLAAEVESANEAARIARQKAEAERIAAQAENLLKWLAGQDIRNNFAETKLRIKADEIETTHGARIPLAHAVALWPMLARWKAEGKTYSGAINGRTIKLGHYAVDSFDGQTLKVGCHYIPWDELERIAGLLGLEKPEPVAA